MLCIFKCPNCNGTMNFNVETQLLECLSCGVQIAAEDYDAKQIVFEGINEYGEDTITYHCPSCAAEVEIDSSQVTCTCRYCGNEMASFNSGKGKRMAPEKIVPFSISRNEAESNFSRWWLDHDTMPDFDRKRMKFTLEPMYVPVWLVNANTKTDMTAIVRREESADARQYAFVGMFEGRTNAYEQWGNSGSEEKTTRRYKIRKALASKFFKVPTNASYHFSSTRFYGIEPYNYTNLEDFSPGYLSGFPAEHYSIEASDIIPRALNRVMEFGLEQCRVHILGNDVGESKIVAEQELSQSVELKQVIYAMVPVWICSYTFMGKRRLVYVNGQTGKTDGEIVTARERLLAYSVTVFLATLLEYFAIVLLCFSSPRGLYTLDARVLVFLIFGFFITLEPRKAGPVKVRNRRNPNDSGMEMFSDIDYVYKSRVKPRNVMIRKLIIGGLLLPLSVSICNTDCTREAVAAFPWTIKIFCIAVLVAAAWTALFMKIHLKNEAKQTPAEYNDYLNMSITDIIESSEELLRF